MITKSQFNKELSRRRKDMEDDLKKIEQEIDKAILSSVVTLDNGNTINLPRIDKLEDYIIEIKRKYKPHYTISKSTAGFTNERPVFQLSLNRSDTDYPFI